MAEFWRRTGHPGSAYFYYEIVRRRYPDTRPDSAASRATQRMLEIRAKMEKEQRDRLGPPPEPELRRPIEQLAPAAPRDQRAGSYAAAAAAAGRTQRGADGAPARRRRPRRRGHCPPAPAGTDKSMSLACRQTEEDMDKLAERGTPRQWSRRSVLLALAGVSLSVPACTWSQVFSWNGGKPVLFGYGTAPNYDKRFKTVRVKIFKDPTFWAVVPVPGLEMS